MNPNNKGFTMTGLAVSLGIGAITIALAASVLTRFLQAAAHEKHFLNISSYMDQVNRSMNSPDNCSSFLTGVDVSDPSSLSTKQLPDFPDSSKTLLSNGIKIPGSGLQASNLVIQEFVPFGTTSSFTNKGILIGQLDFVLQSDPSSLVTQRQFHAPVELEGNFDSSNPSNPIAECLTTETSFNCADGELITFDKGEVICSSEAQLQVKVGYERTSMPCEASVTELPANPFGDRCASGKMRNSDLNITNSSELNPTALGATLVHSFKYRTKTDGFLDIKALISVYTHGSSADMRSPPYGVEGVVHAVMFAKKESSGSWMTSSVNEVIDPLRGVRSFAGSAEVAGKFDVDTNTTYDVQIHLVRFGNLHVEEDPNGVILAGTIKAADFHTEGFVEVSEVP